MIFDDFPLDPSPTDVDLKAEIQGVEDVSGYWDGCPMTSAEMAEELNALARGEISTPIPNREGLGAGVHCVTEAQKSSDLSMRCPDDHWHPQDDMFHRIGRRETMFETLPEMDQIIENECIM
jgi:hypothetical protein